MFPTTLQLLRCSLLLRPAYPQELPPPRFPTSHRRPLSQRLATLSDRLALVKSRFQGFACRFLVGSRSVRVIIMPPLRPVVNFRPGSVSVVRLWFVKVPVAWSSVSLPHSRGSVNFTPFPASTGSRPRPGSCEIITLASACQIRLSASLTPSVRRFRLPSGACPSALVKLGPSAALNLNCQGSCNH